MKNSTIGVYIHDTGEVFGSKSLAAKALGLSTSELTNLPKWLKNLHIFFFSWPIHCSQCDVELTKDNTRQNRNICIKCYEKERERTRDKREQQRKIKRYNLEENWYEVTRNKQQGCCAICGLKTNKLNIDHNHKTGKVRGLLCWECNVAMGKLKIDDGSKLLEKALEYVHQTNTSI